jgi:ABC-type glycerol-3-phosphate transport system substrate-binding protein
MRSRYFIFGYLFSRRFILLKILVCLTALVSLGSCTLLGSSNTLILWTDRPEFALYGDYFNASQDKYKVEVRYFESPAYKLTETGEYPDLIAASWLKSAPVRSFFKPLDSIFQKDGLKRSDFYPKLLSQGVVDGHQYILPVNYNIPAMIFSRESRDLPSNSFTIEMEEIKEKSKAFNVLSNGVYSKMGFSLSSNDEFLFIAAVLFGAAFREASPIAWENQALEQSIAWVQKWVEEANTSIQVEDDFAFKYFYDPPDKLVNSGRILYTFIDSSGFFTLPEERRINLDFRWIAANDMIPLDEGGVYFGIHKKTKALKAAKAFTNWFFTAETQKLLLEKSKSNRLYESSFGIAGGFSAMKTVTEQVFPQFYPSLLGRMPPESYLSPPNILPRNWMAIKERVILPYLRDRIRHTTREEVRSLERRISDWYRLNRD